MKAIDYFHKCFKHILSDDYDNVVGRPSFNLYLYTLEDTFKKSDVITIFTTDNWESKRTYKYGTYGEYNVYAIFMPYNDYIFVLWGCDKDPDYKYPDLLIFMDNESLIDNKLCKRFDATQIDKFLNHLAVPKLVEKIKLSLDFLVFNAQVLK